MTSDLFKVIMDIQRQIRYLETLDDHYFEKKLISNPELVSQIEYLESVKSKLEKIYESN